MSKLILHIGTHKTASTAIQDTLHLNARLLAKKGLIYPDLAKFQTSKQTLRAHHALATEWAPLPEAMEPPDGTAAIWRMLSKKYARTDKTVIVSSEEFSRARPTPVSMKAIREYISEFDEVEVVIVLRNQINYVQSIFLEISRSRVVPGFSSFIQSGLKNRMCAGFWLNYERLYENVLKGFSPEEIHLVSYENASSQPNGIVGEFLAHVAPDFDYSTLIPAPRARPNTSADPLSTFIANTIASPNVGSAELRSQALEVLHEVFGDDAKSTIFNRQELQQYQRDFEPINRSLEKRVAPIQPDFKMASLDTPVDLVHRGMLANRFWFKFTSKILMSSTNSVSD